MNSLVHSALTGSIPTAQEDAMSSLIERLEAAETGSRVLDGEIWCATNGYEFVQWDGAGCVYRTQPNGKISHDPNNNFRAYSASLDAALGLANRILPGWDWSVTTITTSFGGIKRVNALIVHPDHPADSDILTFGEGETPALALCIAILRAAQEEAPSTCGMTAESRNETKTPNIKGDTDHAE